MKLSIRDVQAAKPEEWDHIWKNCDYSTYFHSREWAEIWKKYASASLIPEARIIHFSDSTSALLPCSYKRVLNGLFKQYLMSPAGTFGGWLSLDRLAEPHSELMREYILGSYRNLVWRANPYNILALSPDAHAGGAEQTQSLNLECGFELIYSRWTKGHKAAAKQARKAGVMVREANSFQDWSDYFEVYEDTLERWGDSATARYKWDIFRVMYECSSSNIKLWVAIYDDRVIAGAICLHAKEHVAYWHGASLASCNKLRSVNLLMFEIIGRYCTDGYRWFDFNPSGDLNGVRAFKKSFGAEDLPCSVYSARSELLQMLDSAVALKKKFFS